MKSCCFTGHRKVKYSELLLKKLNDTIEAMIKKGVTDFYAGGAIGWDTICAEAVLKLRNEKYSHIRLNMVLPCPESEQTAKWSYEQKQKYCEILNAADNMEIVSLIYTRDCMKRRNLRLVELAESCICYYDEGQNASGTGQTVRLAQQKGIQVINLYEA